jgi:HNH endonuclease
MYVHNNYKDDCLTIIQINDKAEIQQTLVLVDPEDIPRIKDEDWYIRENGYIACFHLVNRTFSFLHRVVMGAVPGMPEIDHVDRDKLNCKKNNLEFCTRSENLRNRRSWKVLQ